MFSQHSTVIASQKRAGSVVPLSFLRSHNSLGVGNFDDLKLYVELAVKRGETIVQLLPLNDTGSLHLWPYSAVSSFAINPVYISVQSLFSKYKHQLSLDAIQKYQMLLKKAQLMEQNRVLDYPIVRETILSIIHLIYKELSPHIAQELIEFQTQYSWVQDYAIFSVISEKNNFAGWFDWTDEQLRNFQSDAIRYFHFQNADDIFFYIFCQKIALDQLKEVRRFANERGVYIKGDIPILVDRNSADVWSKRNLFLLDYGAGAPPDMFTIGGQEWGSPPLNLDCPDAISYFLLRFQFGQQYMDIVRIDHVLGLFRLMIWGRNKGNIANQGFFYPQKNSNGSVSITRDELMQLGINPDLFTKQIGVITDTQALGETAQKCVQLGLAKWIQNRSQIAWISDPILGTERTILFENWNQYANNLNFNEDYICLMLRDHQLTEDEIWNVIHERRRLQNMLGYYLEDSDHFFLTVYGTETWHYINLSDWQKKQLELLLKIKETQQYAFWKAQGKAILQHLMSETTLFLCAEDLGKVDPYIPDVLTELGIPGISIIRWTPSFRKEDQRYMAVLTTSTHDTSTLHQWWDEPTTSSETKSRFWREYLGEESTTAPVNLTIPQLQDIFLDIYNSASLMVIQPFWEILHVFYQEPDKRINLPGTSSSDNWCQRMAYSLEIYLAETAVSDRLKTVISQNGRI